MKNSTKIKIIDFVKKVLRFNEPINQKLQVVEKTIETIQLERLMSSYQLILEDTSFIRYDLLNRLFESLSNSGYIEFIEESNIYDSNRRFIVRIKIVKP